MYKDVLTGLYALAMCVLILLATRLQALCLDILLEMRK